MVVDYLSSFCWRKIVSDKEMLEQSVDTADPNSPGFVPLNVRNKGKGCETGERKGDVGQIICTGAMKH